jgi:flagellar operon protein
VITTIDRTTNALPATPRIDAPAQRTSPPSSGRPGIAGSFQAELAAAAGEHGVSVSGHALHRLEQRQIDLGSDHLERLDRAMDTLARKGGRHSLVMLDDVAYVVHVPSHTVMTAVRPGAGKENVFTQIDSVVVA